MNKIRRDRLSKIILIVLLIMVFALMTPIGQSESYAISSIKAGNSNIEFTFDKVEGNYERISPYTGPISIELWHYSAGYWGLIPRPGDPMIRINDSEIPDGDLSKLEEIIKGKLNGFPINIEYPDEVKKAIFQGKKVIIQMLSDKNHIGDYLYDIEDMSKHKVAEEGGKLVLRSNIKFAFQRDEVGEPLYYHNFNLDTGFKMPFVRQGFGANGYSIYNTSGGRDPGVNDWASWWNWGQTAGEGYIHPNIINKNGTLHSGYNIGVGNGKKSSSSIRVGASPGVFNSGGALGLRFVYPFQYRFFIEKEHSSNIVVNELQIIDKATNQVVDSFKREVDPLDPFDLKKQKLVRTTTDVKNAPIVEKGKTYKLRSTYQYISFEEGEFDISKPGTMNEKQKALSTKINSNKLNTFYSYDDLIAKDGQYSKTGQVVSSDKGSISLKNLEKAIFEWDYTVPQEVKEKIALSVRIPDEYDAVNGVKGDDWATVYTKLPEIDLAAINPVILYDKDGKETLTVKNNENHKVKFSIKHVLGDQAVGTDNNLNPKATIDIVISDTFGKVIYKETKSTNQVLNKGQTIEITSNNFKTTEREIVACATINPIHKEKGFNSNPNNDKVCKTFSGGGTDIGMTAPLVMLSGSTPQKFVTPHQSNHFEFNVKHYSGNETVGLNPTTNPKVKVNITISDGNKTEKQSVMLTDVLKPGEVKKIKTENSFTNSTGKVKVCATIDPKHKELGFNTDPSNDTICAEFDMEKNYSMQSVRVTPTGVNLGQGQNGITVPVSVNYTIGHQDRAISGSLSPNPTVHIRHNGNLVWSGSKSLTPNGQTSFSDSLNLTLSRGNNRFTVEVNPSRTEVEFIPGVANPYADNIKEVNVLAKNAENCPTCVDNRTSNTWTEEFTWTKREHKWFYPDPIIIRDYWGYIIDIQYPPRQCRTNITDITRREIGFSESFEITDATLTSKWGKDVRGGKVNLKTTQPKIKSGYGFEIEVKTHYETNRVNLPSPEPYGSATCNSTSLSRSPGVTPIDYIQGGRYVIDHQVYLELPFMKDKSGKNVCYVLEKVNVTGSWSNQRAVFQIPQRRAVSGGMERKIYVKEHSQPGNYPIQIRTSRKYGYMPNTPVNTSNKKLMQDCLEDLTIIVLPQDDIKSHIIQ